MKNHNLLFYNLSERGNPKGSVACCCSSWNVNRKGANPMRQNI
ncbi:hypothetical protein EVA_11351 [gut metagenome]|uniref:Uncharacterized protein n=1 Tax=gut metagenome TaxID=749906 RepID=J9GLE4_9ZZZZ